MVKAIRRYDRLGDSDDDNGYYIIAYDNPIMRIHDYYDTREEAVEEISRLLQGAEEGANYDIVHINWLDYFEVQDTDDQI